MKCLILVSCVAIINCAYGLKFPKHYKRCKVSEAMDNIKDPCLLEAAEKAVLFLADNGDPYIGAPDIDPLAISKIYIGQGTTSGPVSVNLSFTNMSLTGFSNYSIDHIYGKLSSPKDFKLYMGGNIPRMLFSGDYAIEGRVLLLPIVGAGKCRISLKGVSSNGTMWGQPRITQDKEYLKITNTSLDLKMAKISMHFDNLFSNDKALSDNMNKMLNENWAVIYGELGPAIEDVVALVFKNYAKLIMEAVPFNKIFIQE